MTAINAHQQEVIITIAKVALGLKTSGLSFGWHHANS